MVSPLSVRWSAYEHEHVERGSDWYWALGIASVSLAITSILFGNVLFAILIVIAAITLGIISRHPPPLVEFELSDRGILIGHTMHRYEEIISFWVDDERPEGPILLIDTTKFMSPNLIIPIEDVEPEVVRDFLRERVNEVRMKEPVFHKILEFFGV